MRGEGWKGEERIFGAALDDSEFFGEGGGDKMDLFGGSLACRDAKVETCEASSHMLLVTQRSNVFLRGGGGRLHRRGSGRIQHACAILVMRL